MRGALYIMKSTVGTTHCNFVQRSFAHAAPRVWNSLPHTITDDLNLCTSFQIQT